VVARADIDAAVTSLTERLRFYTPDIEPSCKEPGVFWLGASGLSLLYPSLLRWAELVRDEVARAGFAAAVVIGFTRFGTYALARSAVERDGEVWARRARAAPMAPPHRAQGASTAGVIGDRTRASAPTGPALPVSVLESPADERARAARVPLSRLFLQPDVRDTLEKLGITTLGGFLELPANGVHTRFGEDAHHLHREGNGDLSTPLRPAPPPQPVDACVHFDDPENNLERLLTVLERELRALARVLDERGRALSAVAIQLAFDDGTKTAERLQPASPTLDLAQIVELLRLRLAAVLSAHADARGVTGFQLECEGAAADHTQGELFASSRARDSAAAARAIARVRAELGDDAVVRAVLRDGHLPEARFTWERVDAVVEPKARVVRTPPLVRRIYRRALSFSPGRHRGAEAELIRHIDEGTVRETLGPYIVSGGWWTREVQREYYFVRTSNARVLWMYYDRRRMGWFIQGEVE
jgi:protein ImuB